MKKWQGGRRHRGPSPRSSRVKGITGSEVEPWGGCYEVRLSGV
eukprot:CAMPEP_0172646042 /NCGR_PEP_ID=MMETSP1068-20121228/240023_1 /TAXON_ID=35684 /ORGANISM="Pseudopedinella elastica, Strain CCMP716" /LENGTH=42 /DNA_ID= /DNA_START= /DNA_END= /DNA_ORIENTATION=